MLAHRLSGSNPLGDNTDEPEEGNKGENENADGCKVVEIIFK